MKHGTRLMYTTYGCRCGPCTEAAREYRRLYEKTRRERPVVHVGKGLRARNVVPLAAVRRLVKEETDVDAGVVSEVAEEMPKTRAECPTVRPCPWLGCRYHLAVDITHSGGLLPPLEDWASHETCALDVADRAEMPTLDAIGDLLGLTRERIRQIEAVALRKLREGGNNLEAHR